MNSPKLVQWSLSPQQADQVLRALAQRPYAEVAELIQNLLAQANAPQTPQEANS